jgi:hypothetical protein
MVLIVPKFIFIQRGTTHLNAPVLMQLGNQNEGLVTEFFGKSGYNNNELRSIICLQQKAAWWHCDGPLCRGTSASGPVMEVYCWPHLTRFP